MAALAEQDDYDLDFLEDDDDTVPFGANATNKQLDKEVRKSLFWDGYLSDTLNGACFARSKQRSESLCKSKPTLSSKPPASR